METYSSSLENGIGLATLFEHNVKRACFNWGIGRELYTSPFIWIPNNKCEIVPKNQGGFTTYDTFHVTKLQVDDGYITGLTITCHDRYGKFKNDAYELKGPSTINESDIDKKMSEIANTVEKQGKEQLLINEKQVQMVHARAKDAGLTDEKLKFYLNKWFGFDSVTQLTNKQKNEVLSAFEQIKERNANNE